MKRLIEMWKKGYPIALGVILVVTAKFLKSVKLNCRMVFIISIGTIVGILWGIDVQQHDAWSFHDWALFIPIKIFMVPADWIFYPLCGTLFTLIIYKVKKGVDPFYLKLTLYILLIGLTIFFSRYTGLVGRSIAWYFSIPAIVVHTIYWKKWNTEQFGKIFCFVVIFASAWDLLAVNLIPSLPHWYYNENLYDLWILKSPVEITPWFGISGAYFIYSLYVVSHENISNRRR